MSSVEFGEEQVFPRAEVKLWHFIGCVWSAVIHLLVAPVQRVNLTQLL